MAKLKDIRVGYKNEYTINMGNFENQKPGYEISALVEGGVSKAELEEVRNKLKSLLDAWLVQDIQEVKDS